MIDSGELKIAEVTSRLKELDAFIKLINDVGFKSTKKVRINTTVGCRTEIGQYSSNTHFVLLEFQKIPREIKLQNSWEELAMRGVVLQPCEYKRR